MPSGRFAADLRGAMWVDVTTIIHVCATDRKRAAAVTQLASRHAQLRRVGKASGLVPVRNDRPPSSHHSRREKSCREARLEEGVQILGALEKNGLLRPVGKDKELILPHGLDDDLPDLVRGHDHAMEHA